MSGKQRYLTSIKFRFTCSLPVVVYLGEQRWQIRILHFPKGKCVIDAGCGVRGGSFVGGRESVVSSALSNGISVPVGTIRHKLVMALVADGRAVIENALGEDPDEVPM